MATFVSFTEQAAPAATFDEARLAPAYEIVEREIAGPQAPGAVLALARREGTISVRAFGRARWEPEDVPARPDTIYGLASITKPIVAAAVMQQVERGKFLLDDSVDRHIPEFGAGGKSPITVRHLLTHTSGLDDAWVMERFRHEPERVRTWEAQVRTICDAPVVSPAGRLYSYSNSPFTILAELVRRFSGLPIDDYLRQHVFDPLGMPNTSFCPPEESQHRVAWVAAATWPDVPGDASGPPGPFPRDLRVPRPSGGLKSTAADLVAFGRACLRSLRGEREQGAALLTRAGM